jgi:hypothetical protein
MKANCKICKVKFEQKKFNVRYCLQTDECIKAFSNWVTEQKEKQRAKQWQKEKKVIKESLLTNTDYLKLAQKVFNLYIRTRDAGLNCVSCDKPIKKGNCDAGHMWSAGNHANVRFNELNVNSQCSRPCNKDLSGDVNNYRIGFIKKYGEEKLKELDAIAKVEKKFTIDELKEIIKVYKEKIKLI